MSTPDLPIDDDFDPDALPAASRPALRVQGESRAQREEATGPGSGDDGVIDLARHEDKGKEAVASAPAARTGPDAEVTSRGADSDSPPAPPGAMDAAEVASAVAAGFVASAGPSDATPARPVVDAVPVDVAVAPPSAAETPTAPAPGRAPMTQFLDFERPIAELEAQIAELQRVDGASDTSVDLHDEVARLVTKSEQLTAQIYAKLGAWQVAQVARHPLRPYTIDYIRLMFTDYVELHGDRAFGDDTAIVGGLARFDGDPVVVIGHQKGRTTIEKVHRRFGMPRPEGYRKAARLMQMAERFQLPVITLIDTPGAYPGVGAEERGQSQAIAANLMLMAGLKVPIICTVIGEGGSGGALALGVGDRLMMLRYSTYSVISPEGCASILWKSADKAADAAEAMAITTDRLASLDIIDQVIDEPLGGAHRDPAAAAASIGSAWRSALRGLRVTDRDDLLAARHRRLMSFGSFREE